MTAKDLHYYEVAVPTPLERTFTYHSEIKGIPAGSRVLVPFGPRKLLGVILKQKTSKDSSEYKTKAIIKEVEGTPIFSPELLKLGRWLSSYYHSSLGEVLKAMVPSGGIAELNKVWHLKSEAEETPPEEVKQLLLSLFGKRKTLGLTTILKKHKALKEQNPHIKTLEFLKKKKWILETLEEKKKKSTKTKNLESSEKTKERGTSVAPKLTNQQSFVLDSFFSIQEKQKPLKPFLLHGITGSGKTEVYLNILKKILDTSFKENERKAQALVLVPEISLTPQMREAFEQRFPGQISVLHSALPDNERYFEIMKIFRGETRVLIGARSSVFAPFQNLKLIVVDEEHDTSYKQTTQFCYHAKDVAVLRANRLGIPIILGSATPSAETFWNAKSERYNLLSLPERIGKSVLPDVHLKKLETHQRGQKLYFKDSEEIESQQNVDIVAPEILAALKDNLKQKKQSIVIVNRRGYAYYLLDLAKKKSVSCPSCSVSMTLHNKMKTLTCHYCDRKISTKKLLEQSDSSFVAIGYGSQKIEAYLEREIPGARIVRLDSDTARNRDNLERTLDNFRNEKIDILVGTQILAKGHDFPKVTCVALLEVDEQLNLPDFRAGERTFQLLVQAAGRAGRSEENSHVFIQTMQEDEPLIKNAISHDYNSFIQSELIFREKFAYPPFQKLALLSFSCLDERLLNSYTDALSRWIEDHIQKENSLFPDLRVQGPYKPGIERINKRWRKHFLLRSKKPQEIHTLIKLIRDNNKKMPPALRFKIDVDPQSML